MHALRIHSPEETQIRWSSCDMPDDARCTLREYYESQIWPERISRVGHRSLGGDREALVKWEQFGGSYPADWRTDFGRFRLVRQDGEEILNPPIGLICDDDLRRWQQRLLDYGLSPKTINGHHAVLRLMLRHAGPRDGGNRYGHNVLMSTPATPALPESRAKNVIPTVGEIDRLMYSVDRLHSEWRPPAFWRALIVFVACYGFRPGDLGRVSLRNLDLHDRDDLRLKFQPTKTAGKYLDPFNFPLRPEVWQYLQAARAAKPDRNGRFFPGVMSSHVYRCSDWNRLVQIAGCSVIKRKASGKTEEAFSLYACRRFANVWINEHNEGWPGEWLLGHKFKDRDRVNLEHYTDFLTPPASVEAAMLDTPLPDSFQHFLPR